MNNSALLNKTAFIATKQAELGLSDAEAMLLILIDSLALQNQCYPSPDEISTHNNKTAKENEELLSSLVIKGYLTVKTLNGAISYSMEPLFAKVFVENEQEIIKAHTGTIIINLISVFEDKVGRKLTEMEIQIIRGWEEDGVEPSLMNEIIKDLDCSINIPFGRIEAIIRA